MAKAKQFEIFVLSPLKNNTEAQVQNLEKKPTHFNSITTEFK